MISSSLSTSSTSGPSQRDRAYAALRRLLILQKIPDGQRLREPEWAQRLNVNRAALREAFARLDAEGLIERGPNTGYFVPSLTLDDVREVLKVRTALECAAIDALREHGRPDDDVLAPLTETCDQLAQLIEQDYLLGASEADRRFHERLIALARNRRLSMIYHRAPLPMIHARLVASETWQAHCQQSLDEHRAIIAALRRGRFNQAQQLLREHLCEDHLLPWQIDAIARITPAEGS